MFKLVVPGLDTVNSFTMTAELEDQQEKPKDEEKIAEKIESDDEKIQKIGEEEVEEVSKNGEKKDKSEEVADTEAQDTDGAQDDDDAAVVAPRRRTPRLWERLFSRPAKRHNDAAQDVEAGTELLAKDGSKIEIKEEEGKHEKNDSGTDVTVPITDENDTNGDAPNGKAKEKEAEGKYSRPYWRKVGIGLLVIILLLTIVTVVSILTASEEKARGPMVEPIVVTDCGPLRGYIDDGIYIFKGIPYALPPTGEYRWKPPRSASSLEDCWSDEYQAINNTVYCYQKMIPGMAMEMSEDCLYLDVISPSLSPPKPRPVVVYIPGDSPLQGFSSADLKWRPSAALADEKDITFVTVRYRVGVFGFMTLDLLSNNVRPPTSGNYGIMDMIAALKWVQKNIRGFGGDPEKVTVLAHGGGATAGLALLSSKKTEGLFNQMWLISPAAYFSNQSLSEISEANSPFLKKLDCESVECLYNKSAEEIVHATPSFWNSDWSIDLPISKEEQPPVMTVVDGVVLYDTPYNMWKAGDINTAPVVIGSAAQESGLSNAFPGMDKWSWTDFSDYASEVLGPISTNLTAAAIEFYIRNSSTPLQQFYSMVSDIRTICPLQHLTEALNEAAGKDVYWYLVDYKPSSPVQFSNNSAPTTLSTHGLDIASIFGLLPQYITPMMSSDITFQKNMQDLFYSFANRGAPEIRQEVLMAYGFINIIGDHIQSRMTPYDNCHLWNNEGVYPEFAKVN